MLNVKSILPRFGAEVSGIDFSKPLSADCRREIVETMDRWGVAVCRNTGLDDAGHVAFSRIFGHLELAPTLKGRVPRLAHPELFDASNIDATTGEIVRDGDEQLRQAGNRLWHTDSSFMTIRTSYSLLLAHEVPPTGGKTFFADTRSAYDDLPQDKKDQIEHLELEHSYWYSRLLAGYPLTQEQVDAKPKARHPLVIPQLATGRKALYVASHACDVVGMAREEGQALIKELIDWATQQKYVFSISYKPGDLVIWDNLTSMHRGGSYDVLGHRRDMRRTTVREGTSSQQAGNQFAEYFKASQPDVAKELRRAD
jgi:alpha-ketoglutarate-dependent 2,4-dichlorophenoxyacetate dioxygenase